MKNRTLLPLILGCVLLPATILTAQEAFEISDTFTTGSPGTMVPLEGTTSATGGVSWTATGNVQLTKDDTAGFVTTKDTRVYRAHLPLPASQGTITVEGTVNPASGNDRANWAGIGLGAVNTNFTWENGIFLLVDSNGSFEGAVNVSGKGIARLKREKVPDYEEGKPVQLAIEYDPSSGTVNMSVNGTPVLIGRALEAEQKPRVECAGFSGFGQKSGSSVITQFRASGTK